MEGKQIVKLDGLFSTPRSVRYGVPQGSILGTLLFQFFVNDIVYLPLKAKIILYADDMVIQNHGSDLHQLIKEHQQDLNKICNWLQFNKLTVNAKKSQYMLVAPPRRLSETYNLNFQLLMINATILQRVDSYVYLGIHVDETLSFRKALSSVYGKTSNKMYLLRLMRKYLTEKAAIKIFMAMVLPYMENIFFCISSCTDKDLMKLQRLQNHGLRICCRQSPTTSVLSLHSTPRLLLVKIK